MKIKALSIISFFTIMLVPQVTSAQPDTLWTELYGGDNDDVGRSVLETNDGGFIFTGYTKSSGLWDIFGEGVDRT